MKKSLRRDIFGRVTQEEGDAPLTLNAPINEPTGSLKEDLIDYGKAAAVIAAIAGTFAVLPAHKEQLNKPQLIIVAANAFHTQQDANKDELFFDVKSLAADMCDRKNWIKGYEDTSSNQEWVTAAFSYAESDLNKATIPEQIVKRRKKALDFMRVHFSTRPSEETKQILHILKDEKDLNDLTQKAVKYSESMTFIVPAGIEVKDAYNLQKGKGSR
ncbi:MAG: hypothetical protein LBU87_00030 [Lactobacillales bacterium]|jgi:hypothetical protein|nr:hypothetical protein [Lactobacillales bacterium]